MSYFELAQYGFILLTIVCVLLVGLGLNRSLKDRDANFRKRVNRNYIIGILVWITILAILSLSEFLSDFESTPPKFLLVIVVPLIVFLLLLRSKSMKQVIETLPYSYLTYIQVFRIPVELLLWLLFVANVLPIQMTFEGRNLDILAGISAPIAGILFINRKGIRKWGLVIWNVIGLGLLINIVAIALLSAPTPLRVFMNEPANTAVADFPFVFLPGILVSMAYYTHIISLVKLLKS